MSTLEIRSTDRDAIVEACIRMGWCIDQLDWDGLIDLFADEVLMDYTSLYGGAPERLASGDIVARWAAALTGLDATQHVITNHLVGVDGDRGTCTAHVIGTHRLAGAMGGSLWTFGGTYHLGVVRTFSGWKIESLTLNVLWADGNQQITTHHGVAAGDL
ncbi:nuclear transport factor 2 family protein [Nocardia wallacei]|uniref:nuclear transport factor 2 family protein n=1 Tax=Nocardia wallacei TaxID=480035 RepID=UPI0024560743|nr:nuclear transport factor 2 family protein [Nocardia wallacei]